MNCANGADVRNQSDLLAVGTAIEMSNGFRRGYTLKGAMIFVAKLEIKLLSYSLKLSDPRAVRTALQISPVMDLITVMMEAGGDTLLVLTPSRRRQTRITWKCKAVIQWTRVCSLANS